MPKAVVIDFSDASVKLFDMIECEVKFNDDYFHHESQVKPHNYHNAYDADENFTLFRADAVFLHEGKDYIVPVVAYKSQSSASWKWIVRFRPHLVGNWIFQVRVLCWHPSPALGELPSAKRVSSRTGATYYEHQFGYQEGDYISCPEAQKHFSVSVANLPGPLETPKKTDNANYFYRWTYNGHTYERRPYFLLGTARPWVVKNPGSSWKNYLDRNTELFQPMKAAGCNVLYHWMSPWETQLVHQSTDEYWPQPDGSFRGAYPSRQLVGANASLGYKRFDQGRALRTDQVFTLAQNHQVLIFLSVLSHQSLQDYPHYWYEWGWRRRIGEDFSKLNGFHLFQANPGSPISISQFFKMNTEGTGGDWTRRLWKHFANFWRYIIGRWTAHPALAAWVLIDELEGIGTDTSWWWDNKSITYTWHDNLVKLIRGKLRWKWEGKDLPYTGDYLQHPVTSSTTHYEGTNPPSSRSLSSERALQLINGFGELLDHGRWRGKDEKTDFVTHHAYQSVPTWGKWQGPPSTRRYKNMSFSGWFLPNSEGTEHIAPNHWLWDSLCMRLHNWGKANSGSVRLITEYGCIEREEPSQKWDYYGKRFPSFTHFANWSSLVLGHAGIPFKWNDGAKFGEMTARTASTIWNPTKYPPDSYAEITSIANFLRNVALDNLYPVEFEIVDNRGKNVDYLGSGGRHIIDTKTKKSIARFNAWGLVDLLNYTTILAWIYDRTFTGRGTPTRCWLKITGAIPGKNYNYAWFDTWTGKFMPDRYGEAKSDRNGILKIEVPRFTKSSKDTIKGISDDNDIAIRLTIST